MSRKRGRPPKSLEAYASEFKDEGWGIRNVGERDSKRRVLMCLLCRSSPHVELNSETRRAIMRHNQSQKHIELVSGSARDTPPIDHAFSQFNTDVKVFEHLLQLAVIREGLRPSFEPFFSFSLIVANLPLGFLNSSKYLMPLLCTKLSSLQAVSTRRTLETSVTIDIINRQRQALKTYLKDKSISLTVDEASKHSRAFVHIIAQFFDAEASSAPQKALLSSHFVSRSTSCDNQFIKRTVLETLRDYEIDFTAVTSVMSDNVAYMKKAGLALREELPTLLLIHCPSHFLHLVAQTVTKPIPASARNPGDHLGYFPQIVQILGLCRDFSNLQEVVITGRVKTVPSWAETR